MTKFLELVLLRSPMGRAPAPGGPSGCSELLEERKWGFTLQTQRGAVGPPCWGTTPEPPPADRKSRPATTTTPVWDCCPKDTQEGEKYPPKPQTTKKKNPRSCRRARRTQRGIFPLSGPAALAQGIGNAAGEISQGQGTDWSGQRQTNWTETQGQEWLNVADQARAAEPHHAWPGSAWLLPVPVPKSSTDSADPNPQTFHPVIDYSALKLWFLWAQSTALHTQCCCKFRLRVLNAELSRKSQIQQNTQQFSGAAFSCLQLFSTFAPHWFSMQHWSNVRTLNSLSFGKLCTSHNLRTAGGFCTLIILK